MPNSADILRSLAEAAHVGMPVAVVWHLVLAAILVLLASGYRPSTRRASLLLSLPLASVALLAAATGNPFNALVFGALAVALAVLSRGALREPIGRRGKVSAVLGTLLVVVGAVYPHFLDDLPATVYLYAAPLGVVPCATLYVLVGLALVGRMGTRGWNAALAAVGLTYGVIGAFRLGVMLDLGLLLGSAVMLATCTHGSMPRGVRQRSRPPASRPAGSPS